MILVFGGSYNGKLDFVKNKYNIKEESVFFCNDENIKFEDEVIYNLHMFIKSCILKEKNAFEIIEDNINLLRDKIIICDEINSGIVPMDKKDRLWREECGKILQYLAKECDECYRVFFGIGEKLK